MKDVLAVDLGTGSVRGVRYDASGAPARESRRSLRILEPSPTRSEHDSAEVASAFEAVIGELASPPPAAICAGGYLHAFLALDERGDPLGPIQLWSDGRASAEASRLRRSGAATCLHESTGCPPHSSYPRERLAWMAAHDRDRFDAASHFVSPKAWLLARLGAPLVEDEATASATGLFDLRARRWSAEALALASVGERRLPRVVPSDVVIGEVGAAAARRTGLRAGTPIVAGAGDGMLAAIGSGADVPGVMSSTVGTSAALRVAIPSPPRPAVTALWCYVLDRASGLLGAATNAGAGVLDWARTRWAPELADASALEAAIRSRVESPASDLLVLPFVRGERAPCYEPGWSLAIGGATETTSPIDLLAATWRGVAIQVAHLFEEVERAAPQSIDRIVASGGGFRSALLAQALADAIGREIELPRDLEASARGAWLLGRRALADRESIPPPPIGARLRPDPVRHERFRRDLARQKQALDLLRPIWRTLAGPAA